MPTNPDIKWICHTSAQEGCDAIKRLLGQPITLDTLRLLQAAEAYETDQPAGMLRTSLLKAIKNAVKKVSSQLTAESTEKLTKGKAQAVKVEVTTELPRDPAWDQARAAAGACRTAGRFFLRSQVRFGMVLASLKKAHGIHRGQPKKNSAGSAEYLPWDKVVQQETGYSRRSCDVFIELFEKTTKKLKTAKKLALPAPARKDALVLFQSENPLALTDEQWAKVDHIIGTLTDGETQASLMQELGIVPKKKMPENTGKKSTDDELTAGQLAFHFFEAMAGPLFNARTSPDYKKLLLALPPFSDDEHPISLGSLEAEARALLADIDEAKKATTKTGKAKLIEV